MKINLINYKNCKIFSNNDYTDKSDDEFDRIGEEIYKIIKIYKAIIKEVEDNDKFYKKIIRINK